MKRIFAIILAAFAVTGCATGHEQYYTAIKAAEDGRAAAQAAQATAILKLANDGDAQAKGMALMYFAMQGAKGPSAQTIIAPPTDPVLEWAKVLVNPLVNIWGITEGNRTARHSSDNALRTHQAMFGTLENIAVTGMEEAGKVTIPPVYTVPMGSAPAESAEAPPAPAVTP